MDTILTSKEGARKATPEIPRQRQGRAPVDPERKGEPLGYRFDPVPRHVPDLVHAGTLIPTDSLVLAILLRFPRADQGEASCWCTKSAIAARLNLSPRTVQRSLGRLGDAGLIEQRPVPNPDPADPRNRTGWRVVFLWMASAGYQAGPGPDRSGQVTGGRHPCLPPLETPVSPPPETPVSPKYCAGASNGDRIEIDQETPSSSLRASEAPGTDDDDFRCASGEGNRGADQGKAKAVPLAEVPIVGPVRAELAPEIAGAIAVAAEHINQATADKIRADRANLGRRIGGRWDWFPWALFIVADRIATKKGKPIGDPADYAVGIVSGFDLVGGITQEARNARRDVEGRAAKREADKARMEPKPKPPPVVLTEEEEIEQLRSEIKEGRETLKTWPRGTGGFARKTLMANLRELAKRVVPTTDEGTAIQRELDDLAAAKE